ncbi:hypothetical protein [Sedimenticola sp.]|uniref:hypothetical protein n=1 Tax=Sedimenticola sp. TaxID=1940285 RepID=UPI003D0D6DED
MLGLVLLLNLGVAFASGRVVEDASGIAALYETRQIQLSIRPTLAKQQWRFWRTGNHVEKSIPSIGRSEVWEKRGDEISFSHHFIDLERAVDYTSGDLKALGQYPDWDEVAHIISPSMLEKLVKVSTRRVFGYDAVVYSGQFNATDVEIVWIDELKLPALIREVHQGQEFSVHLLEIYPARKAPWSRPVTSYFKRLDYADLGDNEADPVWGRLAHQSHNQHNQSH